MRLSRPIFTGPAGRGPDQLAGFAAMLPQQRLGHGRVAPNGRSGRMSDDAVGQGHGHPLLPASGAGGKPAFPKCGTSDAEPRVGFSHRAGSRVGRVERVPPLNAVNRRKMVGLAPLGPPYFRGGRAQIALDPRRKWWDSLHSAHPTSEAEEPKLPLTHAGKWWDSLHSAHPTSTSEAEESKLPLTHAGKWWDSAHPTSEAEESKLQSTHAGK